jgi:triacylglycerol lipase
MRYLFYIIVIIISCTRLPFAQVHTCDQWDDFSAPEQEWKCFEQFNDTTAGLNNVNAFLLAKLTQLMYLDQLEYQMHYIQNESKPLSFLPSSDWIRENNVVSDSTFEESYTKRFQSYFDGPPSESSVRPSRGERTSSDIVEFEYIQKSHSGSYKFLGIPYQSSLDPELIIVSTPTTILLLFRGTDDVGESQWAEWIGTDLKIRQTNAGGALVGTKVHTGFWQSFDLVRDEIIATLSKFDGKNKQIWLAGHSLGGALSIITGLYLKSSGFNVQNIYSYGGPRTIGNKAFIKKANELLPNRIQRLEYFQDPVPLLWAAGFKYQYIGQRHWYDEEKLGQYQLYENIQERVVAPGSLKKYPNIDAKNKKEARRIRFDQLSGLTLVGLKKVHYHSPQWYVKATYHQLKDSEKQHLPAVDDTYPYLYYYRKDGK